MSVNDQTHLIFEGEIPKNESIEKTMEALTVLLCNLSTKENIRDRVNLLSGFGETDPNIPINVEEFQREMGEVAEIARHRNKLYGKLLNDIEQQYSREDGKILIQVPLSHAGDFIPLLIERKNASGSKFSNLDVEYVIIDPASIEGIASHEGEVRALYEGYIKKIELADKFIQIVDTADANATFVEDTDAQREVKSVASDYQSKLNKIGKQRQNRLRLYFPTEEMAAKEDMNLKEFYELYEKAVSLDWKRIEEANEELAELLREYDTVHIQGPGTDITYDISGMGARNSVVQTNWPGSEVHTAPNRKGVDGTISYDNEVYVKMLGVTLPGITFTFSEGKLETFKIHSGDLNPDMIEKYTIQLEELFNEAEGNRYLGELAFGTNFFVPTGLKHPLIGEKALGMHIAFGKAYNYEGVDNGNNTGTDIGESIETTFHWDAIKDMSDCTVSFSKKDGNSIEVMKNSRFNESVLPKLGSYQKEVDSE